MTDRGTIGSVRGCQPGVACEEDPAKDRVVVKGLEEVDEGKSAVKGGEQSCGWNGGKVWRCECGFESGSERYFGDKYFQFQLLSAICEK